MYFLLLLSIFLSITDGKDIVVVYFASAVYTDGVVKARVNGTTYNPLTTDRTICWSQTWGMEEANVICRQMGFLRAKDTPTPRENYHQQPIIFNVSCTGSESNIADCTKYDVLPSGTCPGKKAVVVNCVRNPAYNGLFDVRLKGPSAHSGIIEIVGVDDQGKKAWFPACFGLWTEKDSEVVCRQLGYSGVQVTRAFNSTGTTVPNGYAGYGGRYDCSGTESTLKNCGVTGIHCQEPNIFAEVKCVLESATQQPFKIRLINGPNEWSGTVQIFKYGHWGVICGKVFGKQQAEVICQQMGFIGVRELKTSAAFGQGPDITFFDNPVCTNAWSIDDCEIKWGRAPCPTSRTVGVVCTPTKFPAYPFDSTTNITKAAEDKGRFFLHSPGFPNLFDYDATTHVVCTLTSGTPVSYSFYVHYKRFKENHQEALSFQSSGDIQTKQGYIRNLILYGDSPNSSPFTTESRMVMIVFKANGVKGGGKFRIETRVDKADVKLTCAAVIPPTTTSLPTTAPPTTASTSTSVILPVTKSTTTTEENPSTKAIPIYIPIVATLVPLIIVVVVVVVVVIICRRKKQAKEENNLDEETHEQLDPDDSGIFEMVPKSKKKGKSGFVNTAFEDLNTNPIVLSPNGYQESPEIKSGTAPVPRINPYELTEPEQLVAVAVEPHEKEATEPQTYAVVNKIRKKPKGQARAENNVYSVVDKKKKRNEDEGQDEEGAIAGYMNAGFVAESPDLDRGSRGEGDNRMASPPKLGAYAEVLDAVDRQQAGGGDAHLDHTGRGSGMASGPQSRAYADVYHALDRQQEGEYYPVQGLRGERDSEMTPTPSLSYANDGDGRDPQEETGNPADELSPEFSTYAEIDRSNIPKIRDNSSERDSGENKKQKSKKNEKSEKKKSKLNFFSRSKKSKSGDQGAKEMSLGNHKSRPYDYIDTQFQQKDTTPSRSKSDVCSPYAEVNLIQGVNNSGARAESPAHSGEAQDGVYNRLNFPMLIKGAKSFGEQPDNLTYDRVKLDKYQDVQLENENPYEGYDDPVVGSNSVDIDNPYDAVARPETDDVAAENVYEDALAVSKGSGDVMWDDGPEELL